MKKFIFFNLSDSLLTESEPAMLELLSVLINNKSLVIKIQGPICFTIEKVKYDVSAALAKKV